MLDIFYQVETVAWTEHHMVLDRDGPGSKGMDSTMVGRLSLPQPPSTFSVVMVSTYRPDTILCLFHR